VDFGSGELKKLSLSASVYVHGVHDHIILITIIGTVGKSSILE